MQSNNTLTFNDIIMIQEKNEGMFDSLLDVLDVDPLLDPIVPWKPNFKPRYKTPLFTLPLQIPEAGSLLIPVCRFSDSTDRVLFSLFTTEAALENWLSDAESKKFWYSNSIKALIEIVRTSHGLTTEVWREAIKCVEKTTKEYIDSDTRQLIRKFLNYSFMMGFLAIDDHTDNRWLSEVYYQGKGYVAGHASGGGSVVFTYGNWRMFNVATWVS